MVLASLLGIAASWALDQRVRSINTLRRTQARVFANMPDAVAVLDDSGRLVRSSQALQALVPPAQQGQRLHPAMHHVLADGRDCPGGCALDVPHGVHAEQAIGPVPDETISPNGSPIHIEYTAGRIDDHLTVVTLRDVSDLVAAEEDRRALLEEAAREHEQQHRRADARRPDRWIYRRHPGSNWTCGVFPPAMGQRPVATSSMSRSYLTAGPW